MTIKNKTIIECDECGNEIIDKYILNKGFSCTINNKQYNLNDKDFCSDKCFFKYLSQFIYAKKCIKNPVSTIKNPTNHKKYIICHLNDPNYKGGDCYVSASTDLSCTTTQIKNARIFYNYSDAQCICKQVKTKVGYLSPCVVNLSNLN